MYIVICGTINKDVNSIRINTNNSHLCPSFALAEIDSNIYRIEDYDGSESIITQDEQSWIVLK